MVEAHREADQSPRSYSTAFDKMTKGDHNDLIGLVAYARYKQMVRDEVLQGQRTAGTPKNPSDQVVEFYRNAARQELQTFAANAIDEAAEEIQQSALLDRINSATSEIQRHISDSTGALRAITTNVIAWAFTLLITLLAFLLLQQPELFERFRDSFDSYVDAPAEESDIQLSDQ
ncbi:hypothetical protein TG4357_03754 [Thalassovita gelatinovora]|uniref:Uncharacterized protein n=1 Tax=Thalassovita gelatinovora TaxID=53501 RepID=A0A0P1FLJ9_THAGE|nr:hypothetical protein TG4357_03754 [Thalassovita gelatinovora]SEQ57187.1 hypothetical protein SAMN04488043_106215 [Thalassovita gelatinovora]